MHVRGVDDLTTEDVKLFATDHFKTEEPMRIEWIDDTSVNVVYSSSEIGLQALAEFTQREQLEEDSSTLPSLRLRTAKPLSNHPESVLQVRSAVKTDRKKRRAHEASRFYLMHPEHDPRERVRLEFAERRQRGRRDDGYSRRLFDDREHRRRKELASAENFNASMYDDDGGQPGPESRHNSAGESANGDRGRRSRRNIELFPSDPEGSGGRLRNRSASPLAADVDADQRTSSGERSDRNRFRNRSPRKDRYQGLLPRANNRKELFPNSNASDKGTNGRELFPSKSSSSFLKSPSANKSPASNHRRSDAFDAADETADVFSKRMPVPFVDGANDGRGHGGNGNVELFPGSGGRSDLKIRGSADQDRGISIKGGASKGISIKGAASVRELFPSKYNDNEGKELFSDKLEGRGGRRRRAEDMFS